MKTKFDIGEKVLVEAEVTRIVANEKGIKYTLRCAGFTVNGIFNEEEIVKKQSTCEEI